LPFETVEITNKEALDLFQILLCPKVLIASFSEE
jgi:hypothetical protein